MKQVVGVLLIALGMFAGLGAVSANRRPEVQRQDPAERLGQAIGGALCSLALVVPGFVLALSGSKRPSRGRPNGPDEDEEGTDGPIRFACPECGTRLRVARRKAGGKTRCPECEQSVHVPKQSTLRSDEPGPGAAG